MKPRFITKGRGKNAKHIPITNKRGITKTKFSNSAKTESNFRIPTLPNDPPRSNLDEPEPIDVVDKLGTVSGEPVVGFIRDFTGRRSKHKVTLDVELKRKDGVQKGYDGKNYANPLELSISGNIWQRDEADILSGGQMQDTLREALDEGKLEIGNGISDTEFEKLLDIWDEWHLNDLTAGTKRQEEIIKEHENDPEYKSISDSFDRRKQILEDFDAQPDTETEGFGEDGYSFGSAWLFRPLPDDVIEFIREIQLKLEQEDE